MQTPRGLIWLAASLQLFLSSCQAFTISSIASASLDSARASETKKLRWSQEGETQLESAESATNTAVVRRSHGPYNPTSVSDTSLAPVDFKDRSNSGMIPRSGIYTPGPHGSVVRPSMQLSPKAEPNIVLKSIRRGLVSVGSGDAHVKSAVNAGTLCSSETDGLNYIPEKKIVLRSPAEESEQIQTAVGKKSDVSIAQRDFLMASPGLSPDAESAIVLKAQKLPSKSYVPGDATAWGKRSQDIRTSAAGPLDLVSTSEIVLKAKARGGGGRKNNFSTKSTISGLMARQSQDGLTSDTVVKPNIVL